MELTENVFSEKIVTKQENKQIITLLDVENLRWWTDESMRRIHRAICVDWRQKGIFTTGLYTILRKILKTGKPSAVTFTW